MPTYRLPAALVMLTLLVLPALAYAHVEGGTTHGFMAGLAHPFGGLDHLCAMVAVGLWAAQMGQRALWAVPLSFASIMALGGALGTSGLTLPYFEQGILLSVLLLGLLISAAARLPLPASVALVGLFALCHGFAHGSEMPESAAGLTYGAGFVLATAFLHGCGIGLCLLMQTLTQPRITRYVGALIALCGGYLWMSGS